MLYNASRFLKAMLVLFGPSSVIRLFSRSANGAALFAVYLNRWSRHLAIISAIRW